MPVCIDKHSISQQDPLPCFFKTGPQGRDVPINHIIIVAWIIKEETERIIGFKKFFGLKEVPGFDPLAVSSDKTVFGGVPSDVSKDAADLNFCFGRSGGLEFV